MSRFDGRTPPWSRLTVVEPKRAAYADDLYFREAWDDVTEVLSDQAADLLHAVALLSVKPDAVVGRRMTPILDYAVAHGFRPIACAPLTLTRHSMRALWCYDWHVYSVDRLVFSTLWYAAADVLVFFFEDTAPHGSWPASLRLAQCKGSPLPERRRPDDLRTVLRPPNRILNFVHVADEPIDVVRELGIFFDRSKRRAMLADIVASLGHDRAAEVSAQIAALETRHPPHDLDFEASLMRLERAGAVAPGSADLLRRVTAAGASIGWDELSRLVNPYAANVSRWDFISVAAHVIPYERPTAPLLPGVPIERW